jgi:hypothetical protein
MVDLNKAREIAEQFQKDARWRKRGKIAIDIASALLSAIPIAGGPLSVAVDRIGEVFFDPPIEASLQTLAGLVAGVAPEIDKIQDIDARISAIAAVIEQHQVFIWRLQHLAERLQPALRTFHVSTVGSVQEFVDVTIRNMHVLVEAHQMGRNYLAGVRTQGGDVTFNSSGGGHQRIQGSTFDGDSGGVGMDRLKVEGQIRAKEAVVEFGPGGTISFEGGGTLSFRARKPK